MLLRRNTLPWPSRALLLLACSSLLVSSPVDAATSGTVVSANVPTSTSIALTGCAGAPELQLGSLATATTATTSPCHVEFGSNASASLRMFQRDRSGAAMTQVRTALDTRSGVPPYRAIDLIDANTVWVGGSRVNSGDVTPLKYTLDGGTNWTDVTPCAGVGTTVAHIAAWSASEVTIINSNKACHTTDSGATWATITTPHSVSGRMFNPPGTDVLWATTGSSGRLMRSADRGLTWASIVVPATTGLGNLVAWGASDAVATNTVTAGDQLSRTAYAWRTTDAGATWTQSTVATIPVTTVPQTTGSLALLDRATVSGRLIAVGSWALGNRFKQYYSDDGGATWTELAWMPSFTDRLRYLGGSTWMGGNRMSTAVISTDDGLTWANATMGGGGTAFMHGISQLRGGAVVSVGDASSVYRSTTTGASWTTIAPEYTSYFATVSFDSNRIAVVAADGSALRSSDAGATLVAASGCGGSNYRDAVATGPTSAIVVGGAGAICRTTDAGATWTSVPSGTGSSLTEVVKILRTGKLIAHGSSIATFIQSTDNGATWSPMTMSIAGTAGLLAVDDDGSTMVISRASVGQMWVSTDFGVTWTTSDDGIPSSLQSLAVSPSGSRILTGHYPIPADNLNRVATSTDDGATWTNAPINAGSGEVLGLRFVSEQRVWGLAGNRIHVSDDAGATFSLVASSAGTATEFEVLDANSVLTSGIGKLLAVSRPTTVLPDVVPGTGLTPAGGAFGACLLGTTNASPSWPSTGTCSAADPVPWRPAPADSTAPEAIVATTSGGTSAADIVFGVRIGPSQLSGSYAAQVVFEVTAP